MHSPAGSGFQSAKKRSKKRLKKVGVANASRGLTFGSRQSMIIDVNIVTPCFLGVTLAECPVLMPSVVLAGLKHPLWLAVPDPAGNTESRPANTSLPLALGPRLW